MDPRGMKDEARIFFGDSGSGSRRVRRFADADDRLRARGAGAGDYLVAVAVEGRVREVGVAVDEADLARASVLRGHFRSIHIRTGAATYTELNVPVTIPNAITHANGRMTSPAKSSSASVAAKAVACVSTERGNVSLIDRFRVSRRDSLRPFRRFSRTRSKMMIVSLSE